MAIPEFFESVCCECGTKEGPMLLATCSSTGRICKTCSIGRGNLMKKDMKEATLAKAEELDAALLKMALIKILEQSFDTTNELGEYMSLEGYFRVEVIEVQNTIRGIILAAEEMKEEI